MSITVIMRIGVDDFILQQEPKTVIAPLLDGAERYMPATVVHCDVARFSEDDSNRVCSRFDEEDDVWSEDFLEVVILQPSVHSDVTIVENLQDKVVKLPNPSILLPEGPYVIHSISGRVYSVYRLFSDPNDAFVRGTLPENDQDRYRWLQSSDYIPVPSKLYYNSPTDNLPLNGMRFGIKDVIDIAGLETGCGSACYRSFYPPKETTAPCIKKLLSAGAVLVGKMRCCQWCDGQDPLERHEEPTPTNPRGDTFQKPSGSSSGSAVGIASYTWLDFTIGTDTGGSIRHPAGVNGIYGVRPSLGSVMGNSKGMLVCSPFFDTPGVFARSAGVMEAVCRVMMDNGTTRPSSISQPKPNPELLSRRYRLLYAMEPHPVERRSTETPKFFPREESRQGPQANAPANIILEDFVQKLEQHLGCRRREVCIYDLWKETHPPDTPEDLLDATEGIYQNLVYSGLANNVVQPFVREYQAANERRMPFIEPSTKARLEYGANVSVADYEKSVVALKAFSAWVDHVLLPIPATTTTTTTTNSSTISQALDDNDDDDDDDNDTIPILVYPQSWGTPRYRDEPAVQLKEGEIFWSGCSSFSISYCSGCPDFTLPLGEVKFRSKVTQTEECLPVTISLLGPRGMDSDLLGLITELERGGALRAVECGSRLYP